ncbi:hypothetical protein J421_1755 [Gemmatirosa kalamazoonensis]|uniref:Outer membrane protein beta-barrel domain-containing protein n=1 Tax=Gemmatirosa kalamazoonensis TaxID=861299 RepID=W0RFT8_9BACT|nr:hypothetical protein [Gemmatirosa kalamazoonensis]AHG89292.1 hypothetical protein J421_1755 [Gemmatirosa kalamazoonensis]
MRNTRIVRLAALGVMLGAVPVSRLAGQDDSSDAAFVRPSVDALYTRIHFAGDDGRMDAPGVGARVMWRGPTLFDAASRVSHVDLGLFASYTPKRALARNLDATTYHLGLAADVRPFATPLGARLDPFASLGLGVLSTHVANAQFRAPSPLFRDSQSAFTLSPGVGARLAILPALGFQADVRDIVTFIDGTRHNPSWSAGMRVNF